MATIQVVVDVEDEANACDAISETLRQVEERLNTGPNNWLVDWRYTPNSGDHKDALGLQSPWREITIPKADNYEEGEAFTKGGPVEKVYKD